MKPFKISDYAAQLKPHTDYLSEIMSDGSAATLKEDRRAKLQAAAQSLVDMLGTGEAATDTDPTLEAEEKRLKGEPTQESARGDKRTASDSRRVAHDSRGAGPTSPWLGTGDGPRGHFDTRFSLDNLLLSSEGAGELAPSIDSVFRREPLGEG
jgi:hypothetical protein